MSGSEIVPEAAIGVFGDLVGTAEKYVDFLRGPGIDRGLIGPREGDRLWERHVLNSTAVSSEIDGPSGEESLTVTDIGSGAGLPGIPLALCRPELKVILVEPLLRRSIFLEEAIDSLKMKELGIDIKVIRGRADDANVLEEVSGSDVVTARAVAPLAKLGRWCAPLIRDNGRLIALKGESAEEELARDSNAIRKAGLVSPRFRTVAVPGADPTYLITATKASSNPGTGTKGRRDKLGKNKKR